MITPAFLANTFGGHQFQGSLISPPSLGSRHEEHCAQLKQKFNASPDQGESINLDDYTLFECVSVLLDYIATFPDLLGRKPDGTKRCEPDLRSEEHFAVMLAALPERNFDLILVIIALFAAYAEFGDTHKGGRPTRSLSYRRWILRLAGLFHTIVVRPYELGDVSSIQTLMLVLKKPARFRSIAMAERLKRELDQPFRPELFGLFVSDAVEIAGYSIDHMPFMIDGRIVFFSGRVPLIVAKCIEKVLCSRSEAGRCESCTYRYICLISLVTDVRQGPQPCIVFNQGSIKNTQRISLS